MHISQLCGISHLLIRPCRFLTLNVLPHSLRSLETFDQLFSCLCHANSCCPVPFSIINALTQKQFPIALQNFRTGYSVLIDLLSHHQFSCPRTLKKMSLLNTFNTEIKLFSPLLNPLFNLSCFFVGFFFFFFNAFSQCKNTNCKLGKEYGLSSGSRLAIIDLIMFTTVQ